MDICKYIKISKYSVLIKAFTPGGICAVLVWLMRFILGFVVGVFLYSSLLHLEFVFCIECQLWIQLYFLPSGLPNVPTLLITLSFSNEMEYQLCHILIFHI